MATCKICYGRGRFMACYPNGDRVNRLCLDCEEKEVRRIKRENKKKKEAKK